MQNCTLLVIVTEKIPDFFSGFFQHFHAWQVNYAEVVRFGPVESAAVNKQDLLIPQKVKGKFFVIGDVEFFNIYLWEHIKCGLRLNGTYAGNVCESFIYIISLLVQPSSGNNVVFNALMTAQSSLDYGLGRHIGAKPHV